jgi:metal-responsive CopG/Arc/MetJ family transcriptional regulator
MKRTTVSLPDDLAAALAREARRRNRSVSEITRDALAAHLGLVADEPRNVPFAGVGRSGHRNTAREMEELLAREWDDDVRGP